MQKIQIAIPVSSDLCITLTWNIDRQLRPATEISWVVSCGTW